MFHLITWCGLSFYWCTRWTRCTSPTGHLANWPVGTWYTWPDLKIGFSMSLFGTKMACLKFWEFLYEKKKNCFQKVHILRVFFWGVFPSIFLAMKKMLSFHQAEHPFGCGHDLSSRSRLLLYCRGYSSAVVKAHLFWTSLNSCVALVGNSKFIRQVFSVGLLGIVPPSRPWWSEDRVSILPPQLCRASLLQEHTDTSTCYTLVHWSCSHLAPR